MTGQANEKETSHMTALLDQLAQAPLFAGCGQDLLMQLLRSSHHRIRRKAAEEYVVYMGDVCTEILILLEGNAYASMTSSDGKEIVLETFQGPLVLAPASVYGQNNRFPVNVVTQTACTFMYIHKGVFETLLHSNQRLMMNFINIVSTRCNRLSERLYEIALHSLRERVLEFLKVNQKIDNVQWMARVMGVARPSLSRVLSELKAEGIIVRTMDGIALNKKLSVNKAKM